MSARVASVSLYFCLSHGMLSCPLCVSLSFYLPSYHPPLSFDLFMWLKPTSLLNNLTVVFVLSGSSSFESQKMDRPSISVTSPMSPSMLRDAPQYLSGQLSVSDLSMTYTLRVISSRLHCYIATATVENVWVVQEFLIPYDYTYEYVIYLGALIRQLIV